jgi:hypothetical protein
MSISSDATPIYRITSYHMRRGDLPAASLASVVAALKADTSGQYQFVSGSGKTLIYDYAPRPDINPNATISLKAAIEWNGISFCVLTATRLKDF